MRRIIASVLLSVFIFSPALAQERKRVALLDFEFGTVQRWWSGNWDIGRGIADLVVTELVTDGTYRVIERRHLETILAEQNFSNSDRANPSTAAQIGKVLGVNAIIVGSVTQFGTEQKKKGIGGAFGRIGGFGAGNVGTQKGKAKVAIDARVIDINTGEILAVAKGTGESSRSGFMLGGAGGGSGGFGAGGIEMGSSDFQDTILGEAVLAAVTELSAKLIDQNNRLPEITFTIDGVVADVAGSTVILNVGTPHGVRPGQTLKVVRVIRTVKDPTTGRVLREISNEVGQIRIDEADDVSSVGTLISGEAKAGDKVKN